MSSHRSASSLWPHLTKCSILRKGLNKRVFFWTLSLDRGHKEKIKDYPQTEHTVLSFSHSDCVIFYFFFISDLRKNSLIRIMPFLFSRPYFHVFFKPVITVLSKKSQSDGCSWGKRYSRVSRVFALSSHCWITERCTWFTVTLHFCYVRTRPALSGPRRQACFLSPETKTKERSGVRFQCTTYQEENSRCAPVLRVFQREAEKEFHVCILVFILFSLTESFKLLFFSVLFNSVSLYIASFFFCISSECCFMSHWGRNKLHMCVSNHRWCFYLPSFWISCVFTGSERRRWG